MLLTPPPKLIPIFGSSVSPIRIACTAPRATDTSTAARNSTIQKPSRRRNTSTAFEILRCRLHTYLFIGSRNLKVLWEGAQMKGQLVSSALDPVQMRSMEGQLRSMFGSPDIRSKLEERSMRYLSTCLEIIPGLLSSLVKERDQRHHQRRIIFRQVLTRDVGTSAALDVEEAIRRRMAGRLTRGVAILREAAPESERPSRSPLRDPSMALCGPVLRKRRDLGGRWHEGTAECARIMTRPPCSKNRRLGLRFRSASAFPRLAVRCPTGSWTGTMRQHVGFPQALFGSRFLVAVLLPT